MKRERNDWKKSKLKNIFFLTLAVLCCAGCAGAAPESGDNLIIMEKEDAEGLSYTLTEAAIGDVILTKRVKCTYLQVEEIGRAHV